MAQILGLGGGGNMQCPSISHLNPNFMFVACDMSGLYRSFDAGQHWQMIESEVMLASTRCPVIFDYKDGNAVYAFDPFRILLRTSLDAGDTWKTLANFLPGSSNQITAMTSIPGVNVNDPTRLFVGTDKGVVEFNAANQTFGSLQAVGEVIKFVFLSQGSTQLLFLATTNGVFQYSFQNQQWSDFHTADLNLPLMVQGTFDMSWCGIDPNNSANVNYGTPIRDLAGAASNTAFVLHASVMTTTVTVGGNPTVEGGIYRFESGQANWSQLSLPDPTGATRPARYDWLGMATNDISIVYTTYCGPNGELGVFKRIDQGAWNQIFTTVDGQWADFDLSPGFGGPAHGFTVCPSNSTLAALTNYAEIYVLTNAGQTWAARYSTQEGTKAAGQPWSSAGLEVTTTWDYVIDSHNPQVHYICYTDIGLARSDNGGQRWTHITLQSRQSGTYNTVYQLAIDSEPDPIDSTKPAHIWAACSQLHDMPYKAQQGNRGYEGGVMMSTGANVGAAFTDFSVDPQGSLPVVGPVTSVLITPRPNQQADRYLYAAVYGVGVYYRKQTGATWGGWVLVGSPAGYTAPLHVYRLHLVDTTLFCVVAGGFQTANTNKGGGLWTLQVGGGQWTSINGNLPTCNPTDIFAVDVNTIYLCANNIGGEPNPGLYFTSNATAASPNWAVYSPAPPINPVNYTLYAPFVDQNGNLYVTTTYRGIFVRSGNNPWRYYKPIGFVGAHRITFDSTTQYITSFGGGAWRVNRQCFFITDRSTFSKDLVDLLEGPQLQNTATFAKSFYLVFDDFVPSELNITTATPTLMQIQQWAPSIHFFKDAAKTTSLPGIQAQATSLLLQTSALDARQRVAFGYDVIFGPGDSAFADLTPTNPSEMAYVSARLDLYSCDAAIELRSTTSPYMLDGDPYWLSQDICAFRVLDNETVFNVTLNPNDPHPAIKFIQDVLNLPASSISAAFDTVRDSTRNQLQWAQMENGSPVYNFALARVHFPQQTGGGQTSPIRAFFRLFRYAATNMIYDTNSTYRIAPNGQIPVLGIDTGTGEIVSVPCFSEPRTSGSMDIQTDALNAKSITPSATQETIIYFGCWLDLNQPTRLFPSNPGMDDGPYANPTQSFQDIVHGKHQCLVVELNYAPDTINPGETPSSSDKLSQKNLFILGSDNPGNVESHSVQHPFELRGVISEIEGLSIERRAVGIEELLIHWNNLSRETLVTIFLPDVDVDEIIAAEATRGGPKFLTRVDAHTVQCRVDGNIAYLPLPIKRQTNIPGLITLQLPQKVVRGQHFTVVLQQASGWQRQIIGTFEISIPVQTAHELLPEEERTLAVLKYVTKNAPSQIGRTEVLKRYLTQLEARVVGLGGKPTAIPASPYGAPADYPGNRVSTWLKRVFSRRCLTGCAGAAVLVAVGTYALRKWLYRCR